MLVVLAYLVFAKSHIMLFKPSFNGKSQAQVIDVAKETSFTLKKDQYCSEHQILCDQLF